MELILDKITAKIEAGQTFRVIFLLPHPEDRGDELRVRLRIRVDDPLSMNMIPQSPWARYLEPTEGQSSRSLYALSASWRSLSGHLCVSTRPCFANGIERLML